MERAELERGNAIGRALRDAPRSEALLDLLALDAERAALADHALLRAGTDALLAAGPPAVNDRPKLRLYASLQDALLTVARRAFYLGDFAVALSRLQTFSPSPDQRAAHELLLGACWRALGEAAQARTHLETAAAASQDVGARAWLMRLARDSALPQEPRFGPFSVR
jgi:hypothetical protein